jgi:LacI family transcriptional regulator
MEAMHTSGSGRPAAHSPQPAASAGSPAAGTPSPAAPQTALPPARRVTLAQVARASDVSLKTASRVLGGEPHVASATRERVLSAARSLGYQRNTAASLLASGRRADYLGLITGDLTNPFYAALAQEIEESTRVHHLRLNLSSSGESPETEWELARSLSDQRCRALIVVSSMSDHAGYGELQRTGMPVVFVDRPARGVEADSVVLDNVRGGQLAAEHLLALGHRDIAYIGDYDWLPTQRERFEGFARAMERSGAGPWRDLVRTGAHDVPGAREAVQGLLSGARAPSAFVAGNNRSSLAVLQELVSRFPQPASRPAIVGFDDVEWAEVLGLTVIAHEPGEMGRRAVDLVLGRLGDPDRAPVSLVLPVRVIARGSGELPPPPTR